MEMIWLLMWLNMSVATLNATLQLLILYRLYDIYNFNFLNLIIEIESSFFQLLISTIYYIRCILKFFIFLFFYFMAFKKCC